MSLFSRDRRRNRRAEVPEAEVVFIVRSGKDPGLVSSPVRGRLRDLSPEGMSVLSPRLAPDGIHIMYDTLMTSRNRIEAEVLLEKGEPFRVSGKVAWFRADDAVRGQYVFGLTFDAPLADGVLPVA